MVASHNYTTTFLDTSIDSATELQRSSDEFDIRNFLDKLTPAKEKNKYICPVCDGHNLSIAPDTGAYQCWSGCECRDIREALSPWESVKGNSVRSYPKRQSKPKAKLNSPKPAPIPDGEIKLARFTPDAVIATGNGETRYPYGDGKEVVRIDKADGSKICYPVTGGRKGKSEVWPAYRESEVLEFGKGHWALAVEGEKCVEAARALGIVSFTMQGSDFKGNLENPSQFPLLAAVQRFKQSEIAGIIFFPDNDDAGAKKAQTVTKACALAGMPLIIVDPLVLKPDAPKKWDIADWVSESILTADEIVGTIEAAAEVVRVSNDIKSDEDDIQFLENNLETNQFNPDAGNFGSDTLQIKKLTHLYLAGLIAEDYRDELLWNVGDKRWFKYAKEHDGLWTAISDEYVVKLVATTARSIVGWNVSAGLVSGAITLLKAELAIEDWEETSGLIPLRDGVLDTATMKLLPHAPGYKFLWQLPYKWSARSIGCTPITDWLNQATKGDKQVIELLRAFLKAAVMGRADLQKFLELVGPGGTGKGTFLRLATALVGKENTAITTLKQLEGNRFETAAIYGKRLVLITDSERYGGEVSVLKALTGQDDVRRERKGIQQLNGFRFDGLVLIGANEPIQCSDYTSGLKRRRCTVPFTNAIPEHLRRDLEKEFEPYLAGVLQWALTMPDIQMESLIKNTSVTVPSLAQASLENLLDTNPIAFWLDERVVLDAGSKTKVGLLGMDESLNLYPNYCKWCEATGSKPVSIRRFSDAVIDVLTHQMKYTGIQKIRGRDGASITGISIRNYGHHDIPKIITEKSFVTSRDGLVTDCVTDSVTSQSLTRYGCDECVESNQIELDLISNTEFDSSNENIKPILKPEISVDEKNNNKECENNPSHPSHPSPARVSSVTSLVTPLVTPITPITSRFPKGSKVRYIGTQPKYQQYRDMELTVFAYQDGYISCKKPDEYLTTWLPPYELELVDGGNDDLDF